MANEKLIAANEVKQKLREIKEWFNADPSGERDKLAQAVVKMCIEEVKKIKPVDAVEVVHGRWIDRPGMKGQVYCSECATIEKSTDSNYKSQHCPNCGAKMDDDAKVNLEDIVDLDAQTKANNEAMRKVIDFIVG